MSVRIVVFDVLGTVLDERGSFRTAVREELPLEPDPERLADRWLGAVSETVSGIAAGREPWRPWDEVIADRLAELVCFSDHRSDSRCLATVGHRLTGWPDSARAIQRIALDHDTVAMSNAGLPALIDCSRKNALRFNALLSSEMVHSAKPDPRVYRFLLDTLHVDPAEILFVAAHPWDLRAAAEHGMQTAYIQRPGEGRPAAEDRFDRSALDLLELADGLECAAARPSAAG